jgi:hypothetical protein
MVSGARKAGVPSILVEGDLAEETELEKAELPKSITTVE